MWCMRAGELRLLILHGCLPYPPQRTLHDFPVQCPVRVLPRRFPWPDPFAPLARHQLLTSFVPEPTLFAGLSLLRVCPTSCGRSSSSYVLRLLDATQAPAWVVAGSPGSRAGCFRACLGSPTARDTNFPCLGGSLVVAFPFPKQGRHPELALFRGSIPSRHFPLSTLRLMGLPTRRMTRGRYGWLNL